MSGTSPKLSDFAYKWQCSDGIVYSSTKPLNKISGLLTDLKDEFESEMLDEGINISQFHSSHLTLLINCLESCGKSDQYFDYYSILRNHSTESILKLIDLMKFLQIKAKYIASVILSACRCQDYGFVGMMFYKYNPSRIDGYLFVGPEYEILRSSKPSEKQYSLLIEIIAPLFEKIDKVYKYCQYYAKELINDWNKGLEHPKDIDNHRSYTWWLGITDFDEFVYRKWIINEYQLTFEDYKEGFSRYDNTNYIISASGIVYSDYGRQQIVNKVADKYPSNEKIDRMVNDRFSGILPDYKINSSSYEIMSFLKSFPNQPDMYFRN